ncbi:DUF1648 domain-containing protein [Microbacterium azadirachtae]|uniref:DUF1648 domain-containing protein n=1 Tax=Microbacterium azadirachtae TaxID=582680 RepID=A0A0F0LVI4_9MICO|nr:DUF1648 domain-containing protein [Microbacterium azadirachtae]KJL36310.1 hypothetical protein RS86_00329 [Microbacterium azadirachtae]
MNARSTPAAHDVTAIPARDLRRARLIALTLGAVVPLVLSAIVLALVLAWLPEVPSPAATHWGPSGVDGFGPPVTFVWLSILLGFVLPAVLTITTVVGVRDHWGGGARLIVGMALGISGLSAVINLGAVGTQRGIADAKQAEDLGGLMLLGFGAFVVLIGIGWLLQPHIRPAPAAPLQPAHVAAITNGERVVWLATASLSRRAMILISLLVVVVVGITAFMAIRFTDRMWVPVLTLVLIGGAFASSASFRVRVGPDGLSVRSQIGFPRVHVPLDEVVSVRAVECNPFGEFGGFGWRLGLDGRTGIVLRRGPAIEVERRDKRPLVVTVDGAAIGAGVLQAYLDRAGAPGVAGTDGGTPDDGSTR